MEISLQLRSSIRLDSFSKLFSLYLITFSVIAFLISSALSGNSPMNALYALSFSSYIFLLNYSIILSNSPTNFSFFCLIYSGLISLNFASISIIFSNKFSTLFSDSVNLNIFFFKSWIANSKYLI